MKHLTTIFITATIIFFLASCGVKSTNNNAVEFVQIDNQINVMFNGKLFTSFKYDSTLTKPILYPVLTPDSVIVNRAFPFAEVEGESKDHPHHTGIFFTYDDVNGSGFWNNTSFPPQVRLLKINQLSGGSTGTLEATMNWVNSKGKVLLTENRTMIFYPGEKANSIDFTINLTAQDTTIVFGDTKEGMFAIRVASWLKEQDNPDSKYRASTGAEFEKDIWGTRADWVLLEGKKNEKSAGIAIMNHPSSTNYPAYWHVRSYGLFAANPLGQSIFQQAHNEQPVPYNLTLQPGQNATFKFRMIIYDGHYTNELINKAFTAYSQTK